MLFWDLETFPNQGVFFSLGKQHIDFKQITKERSIISVAYKWAGEPEVHVLGFDFKLHDKSSYDDDSDKEMLIKFSKVYNEADVTVAHNGKNFDLGWIRGRIAKYQLPDINPIIMNDSYLSSKGLNLNCHKLDYLARYFGLGKKLRTDIELWIDTFNHDEKAFNYMLEYNKKDVILLEKIYNKLEGYAKFPFNHAINQENPDICPKCGSNHINKDGRRVTVGLGIRQVYECQGCRGKFTTGINEIKGNKKKGIPGPGNYGR